MFGPAQQDEQDLWLRHCKYLLYGKWLRNISIRASFQTSEKVTMKENVMYEFRKI